MKPVVESPVDNNVIYIESDDHQESVSESQNLDGNESELPKQAPPAGNDVQGIVGRNTALRSSADNGQLLYGETGTT